MLFVAVPPSMDTLIKHQSMCDTAIKTKIKTPSRKNSLTNFKAIK